MSSFSTNLLAWYSTHQRDLPWRKTTNPYQIAVSEFMLQQTQVSRVIEKYDLFLTLFPTIQALAAASSTDVIRAWSGLGYNRRALLLQRFAQKVCSDHAGEIPQSPTKLSALPGIGVYMRGAIASFAFNLSEPAIDVNVRRIFWRYFRGKDRGKPLSGKIEEELFLLVKEQIPNGKSNEFHNALMDFGSAICTRNAPSCISCPLHLSCAFAPLYSQQKEKVLYVMERKPEKGVYELGKSVPNRIFRGRIVEFARKNQGDFFLDELGKSIKKDYSSSDELWLRELCLKLIAERLLEARIGRKLISLS